jgi:beta-lactam-binding protein with PASTA domain
VTAVRPAAPAVPAPPPPPAPVAEPEPELASITLRVPDVDSASGQRVALSVDPGGRTRLYAKIRNASGIVDNYTLSVVGINDEWVTVMPNPVYLVPFGSAGNYEQEVTIELHPPRAPEAISKIYELQVVAQSAAHNREAAVAPFVLGIQPYEDYEPKLKPEKATGRRRAYYDVTVKNKANAPVKVALGIKDPEDLLVGEFPVRQVEVPAGEALTTKFAVKPPRQIWIGRAIEHRFEVLAKTGDAGEELLAESAPVAALAEEGGEGGGARELAGKQAESVLGGVQGPKFSGGAQGLSVKGPKASLGKPKVPQKDFDPLKELKKKSAAGGGAAMAPMWTGPLLPTQAVFRQKPWIPRWAAFLVLALLLIAVLIYLLLPRDVAVPDVKGKSYFDAQKAITEAHLTLNPVTTKKTVTNVKPGTVLDQTPRPGEKVSKGTLVSLVMTVGVNTKKVPNVTGKTFLEADKIITKAGLGVGPTNPTPPQPTFLVKTQIPAADAPAKDGTLVQLFLVPPKGGPSGPSGPSGPNGKPVPGPGPGPGGAIIVPAIGKGDLTGYAQGVAKLGLVPKQVGQFNDTVPPGKLFGTDPPPGTKVAKGSTVSLLVSNGIPQIAMDDGRNVFLVDGATGKRVGTIAKSPQIEKQPAYNFAGNAIAFIQGAVSGGVLKTVIMLSNRDKPNSPAQPLSDPSDNFHTPAFAPTPDANVLAGLRFRGKDGDLCLGPVDKGGWHPGCFNDPSFDATEVVHWDPSGKAIYVRGVTLNAQGLATGFGIVEYTTKKAFDPTPADWKKKGFVTDTSDPRKGVIDAAVSPDGKTLAVIANFETPTFSLYLTKPNDWSLSQAKLVPAGQVCKVNWRSDSQELVVTKASDCQPGSGTPFDVYRVNAKDPSRQKHVASGANDPVYQPPPPAK